MSLSISLGGFHCNEVRKWRLWVCRNFHELFTRLSVVMWLKREKGMVASWLKDPSSRWRYSKEVEYRRPVKVWANWCLIMPFNLSISWIVCRCRIPKPRYSLGLKTMARGKVRQNPNAGSAYCSNLLIIFSHCFLVMLRAGSAYWEQGTRAWYGIQKRTHLIVG